jgi:hypothetical protein
MSEALGLGRHAARDFLDVAGDVGELNAKAADAVGELVDQPLRDGLWEARKGWVAWS